MLGTDVPSVCKNVAIHLLTKKSQVGLTEMDFCNSTKSWRAGIDMHTGKFKGLPPMPQKVLGADMEEARGHLRKRLARTSIQSL